MSSSPLPSRKATLPPAPHSPFVGCSIGLVFRGVPLVGAIILPFMCFPNPFVPMQSYGTLYSARRGGGAYMNERARLPLGGHAAPMEELRTCVVAAECKSQSDQVATRAMQRERCADRARVITGGSDRQGSIIKPKAASFDRLIKDEASGGKMVHALRTTGSTVTMMAQIASGQMDVHWWALPGEASAI